MTPLKVWSVPAVLYELSVVVPAAPPFAIPIGRPKLKPLPENLGWNTPVPEAAALLKVILPALPPIVLLLILKSTVPAVLEVVMKLSAVTSIGLATGAELADRFAVELSVPERCRVPVPSPRVLVPLILTCPPLIVVSPL